MVLIRPTPRPAGIPPEVGPGHAFYLASSETTVEQFAAFRAESEPDAPAESASDSSYSVHHPQENVTYQEVARYCNWLSQQEGIPESQWCYQSQATEKGGTELLLVEDFTQRRGYRLPTTAEWDFACHGYSLTRHHFGNQLQHITRFGWALQNSGGKMQPVRQLWPDRQGLFDMLGNAMEMCQVPGGRSTSAPYMGGSATAGNQGLGMPGAFMTTQFALVQGGFRAARSVVPSD
jgi:formylglycine-generating enzyme required for sulfatase activity